MKATLTKRFETYWDDMNRCRTAGAHWSLLHVTVCLPDICAALQAHRGKTSGDLYKSWCATFLTDPLLTSDERWEMRNKVLHQGRARTSKRGRYSGYAFGSPSATGRTDHKRLEHSTLHLDVGELANEMKAAVVAWIDWLEANKNSQEARNVRANLPSMIEVSRVVVRTPGLAPFITLKTN